MALAQDTLLGMNSDNAHYYAHHSPWCQPHRWQSRRATGSHFSKRGYNEAERIRQSAVEEINPW